MPALAFCVVVYWLLMAPESSVLPLFNMRVDYRPYPSSAFLFGALAFAGLAWLPRVVGLAAGVAAVVALTAASIQINRTWRTEEALWSHSVALGGDTVANQNLAMAIPDRRDPRIKALLEHAISLAPRNVLAHVNYGFHLIELGRSDDGLRQIKEGVALAPMWGQPHYWLALAHERLEQPGPAAEEALTANGLEPRNIAYAYEAGRLLQNASRPLESLEPLRAVLARNERYKEAKFLEAFALQKTGALDAAIFAYRQFLTWQPGHSQAHFNLGYALLTKENCAAAIPQFERALVLRPDYREVHLYLSICYEGMGNAARAAAERRLLEAKD
jgi:tetratricopeptide (TPR) repeat protein